MKLLISACLLGLPCRYDAKSKNYDKIDSLINKFELIPFCPECFGGLPTPREAAEITGEYVLTKSGTDVTKQYKSGAAQAVEICRKIGIEYAILKDKSPSCGKNYIYDGAHAGTLINGHGITAKELLNNGIQIYCENEIDEFINLIGDKNEKH